MDKKLNNQKGFTLVEVMIALAIFAVYATVMITTQTNNVDSSIRLKTDLTLHNLAELKMNEVLITQKEFTEASDNIPETGQFEVEGFKDYKFKVVYSKNEFPSFDQIIPKPEGEEEDTGENQTSAIEKKIFEKLKKNMESMIWQVSVTVIDPNDGSEYTLSSWVTNQKAKVDTNFAF